MQWSDCCALWIVAKALVVLFDIWYTSGRDVPAPVTLTCNCSCNSMRQSVVLRSRSSSTPPPVTRLTEVAST